MPPARLSSPVTPARVSLPMPPIRVSLPMPPMIESLPASPVSTSLPSPPSMVSLPATPKMMSLPMPPRIESAACPPVSLSLPAPPSMVAGTVTAARLTLSLPASELTTMLVTSPLGTDVFVVAPTVIGVPTIEIVLFTVFTTIASFRLVPVMVSTPPVRLAVEGRVRSFRVSRRGAIVFFMAETQIRIDDQAIGRLLCTLRDGRCLWFCKRRQNALSLYEIGVLVDLVSV